MSNKQKAKTGHDSEVGDIENIGLPWRSLKAYPKHIDNILKTNTIDKISGPSRENETEANNFSTFQRSTDKNNKKQDDKNHKRESNQENGLEKEGPIFS